ncbi:MAG: patatin-like phospholipase family protein [Pseudomonadota bacterium]
MFRLLIKARVLIGAALFAFLSSSHAVNMLQAESVPFVFASSGGVSLGSYQAGVNWGVIRYLKTRRRDASGEVRIPDLRAATGASAGSINTLFTAVAWCLDDSEQVDEASKYNARFSVAASDYQTQRLVSNELTDNLFFQTWREVDIDDLAPAVPPQGETQLNYASTDGLFSRAALERAFDGLERVIKNGRFRAGCEMPIAFTVTRVQPLALRRAGVNLENSRFLVAMRVVTEVVTDAAGKQKVKLRFKSDVTTQDAAISLSDPNLGNLIMLPAQNSNDDLELEQVKEALFASSAFPVAFSPWELEYCEPQPAQKAADGCPDGYALQTEQRFVDGGVFDNIPLGAARALAEPRADDVYTKDQYSNAGRRFSYVYVDPDVRRPPEDEESIDDNDHPERNDLQTQLKFLGGAFSSARNYELYNTLRGGDWSRQTCVLVLQVLAARGENVGRPVFCEPLFELADDQTCPDDVSDAGLAVQCMINQAVELEQQYNLNPFGGRTKSARELAELRERVRSLAFVALSDVDEKTRPLLQLAEILRNGEDDALVDRRLYLTTRYPRVVGELLWAFGAFLDRSFRYYDYYAGVYDALYNITFAECEPLVGKPGHDRCMAGRSEAVYQILCGRSCDSAELWQFNRLLKALVESEGISNWAWVNTLPDGSAPSVETNRLLAIERAIPVALDIDMQEADGFDTKCEMDALGSGDPNIRLFRLLACDDAYQTPKGQCDMSRVFCRIVRFHDAHVKRWYIDLVRSTTDRLMVLEDRATYVADLNPTEEELKKPSPELQAAKDADSLSDTIRTGLGFLRWAAESAAVPDNGDGLYLSTANENKWFNLAPYSIATDLHEGMGSMSWEPRYYLNTKWSVATRISPVLKSKNGGRTVRFSQADVYISHHFDRLGLSSVGFGPTNTQTWQGRGAFDRESLGYSAYVGFLGDKIRLTYGDRSFDSGFAGDDNYLMVGINDIPGIAYWLFGGNRGRLDGLYPR